MLSEANMFKGNIVKVYEDPVTEQKEEGEAVLIRKLREVQMGDFVIEYWNVHFLDDMEGEVFERAIKRTI